MPRGKRYCPYEHDYVDVSEIRVVDGSALHDVEPCHRITDGVLVEVVGGRVVELEPLEAAIDAMGEE